MPHTLKNTDLEIHLDLPSQGYSFSRFDWSGKITKVRFQGNDVSTIERTDNVNEHHFGKGFYNEFGIDKGLGFDEASVGDWFHKIGVGLLKKDDDQYVFNKKYELDPLEFKVISGDDSIIMETESRLVNGFGYYLKKTISLLKDHFKISYELKNIGDKPIITNEYNHNFVSINNNLIGKEYILKFPFKLVKDNFDDLVNTEQKVEIGNNEFTFNDIIEDQFFFSNLTGNELVNALWELLNLKSKIKISETGDFNTNKINIWGWRHVISPELFKHISIASGDSDEWTRTFNFERI
ncbi:MAG: hypothetical protein HKO72_09665 [Flavobacteriaceae bacterium]|nr:hypothetical protein [Bacteroidia bacterium]NNL61583.1 hypothetical protein [Flavobacteriaceae bacterium]